MINLLKYLIKDYDINQEEKILVLGNENEDIKISLSN